MKTTDWIMILLTFIIIAIVSFLIVSNLSEQYFEIASDKCLELDGKLVQYSGCNSFFGSCKHEGGIYCELENGTEIKIQLNST